jgi:hypothetical protein
MICQNLCFRKYPTVKFEQTDIKDEAQLQRVATRLIELGVITPEQGMDVLEKGSYPKPEDMEPAQRKYIEQRKDGMYNPIVGGVPMIEPETGEGDQADQVVKQEVGRPVGTSGIPQESQQSSAKELFSRKNIQQIIYATEELRSEGYKEMRKKLKKTKLKNTEKSMIDELCESIVLSCDEQDWSSSLSSCLINPDHIESLGTLQEIQKISMDYNLDLYSASLLYHSNRRG